MHVFQSKMPAQPNLLSRNESPSQKIQQKIDDHHQKGVRIGMSTMQYSMDSLMAGRRNRTHQDNLQANKNRRINVKQQQQSQQLLQSSSLSYSKSIQHLSVTRDPTGHNKSIIRFTSDNLQPSQYSNSQILHNYVPQQPLSQQTSFLEVNSKKQQKQNSDQQSYLQQAFSIQSQHTIQSRESSPINTRVLNMLFRQEQYSKNIRTKKTIKPDEQLQEEEESHKLSECNTLKQQQQQSTNIPLIASSTIIEESPVTQIANKNNEYIQQFISRSSVFSPIKLEKQQQPYQPLPMQIIETFPLQKRQGQIAELPSHNINSKNNIYSTNNPRIRQFQPLKVSPPLVKMPFPEKSAIFEMGLLSRQSDSNLLQQYSHQQQQQQQQQPSAEMIIHANNLIRADCIPQKGFSMSAGMTSPAFFRNTNSSSTSGFSNFNSYLYKQAEQQSPSKRSQNSNSNFKGDLQSSPPIEGSSILNTRNGSKVGLPTQMDGSFLEEVSREPHCMTPMLGSNSNLNNNDSLSQSNLPKSIQKQINSSSSKKTHNNGRSISSNKPEDLVKLYNQGFDHFHRSQELQKDLDNMQNEHVKSQLTSMQQLQDLSGIRAGVRVTDAEVTIRNQIPSSSVQVKKSYKQYTTPSNSTSMLRRLRTTNNNNFNSIIDNSSNLISMSTQQSTLTTFTNNNNNNKHLYFSLPDRSNIFLTKQVGVFPAANRSRKFIRG